MRLFAMAIQIRDSEPDYADELLAEAIELHDQATVLEDSARTNPPPKTR